MQILKLAEHQKQKSIKDKLPKLCFQNKVVLEFSLTFLVKQNNEIEEIVEGKTDRKKWI